MKTFENWERSEIARAQGSSARHARLAREYLLQDDLQRARDHQEISALWSYAARHRMGLGI